MLLQDFLLWWAMGFCLTWFTVDLTATKNKLTWRGVVAIFLTWPVVCVGFTILFSIYLYVLANRR